MLDDAKVTRAKAMIVSAGREDASILLTSNWTAARAISGKHCVRDPTTSFRASGRSDHGHRPGGFRRLLLANATYGPRAVEYLADLVSSQGRVRLDGARDRARRIRKTNVVHC